MPSRKVFAAAAMTAALAAGGIIGATVGYPSISGAQDGTTSTSVPATVSTATDKADSHDFGGRGFGGGMDLDAAAKVLGVTTDELRSSLQAGKRLADVAKAEGVDKQKVIDALVAEAGKRLDEAKAALPERIAAIVDGTFPGGRPGGSGGRGDRGDMGGSGDHGGRGGPRGGGNLTAAAKVLGVTEGILRTELQAGKSLADVAKAQGVDKQAVIDALVTDAKTRLAEAVKNGKLTQAEADTRAADMADHIAQEVDEVHQGRPGN